MTLSGQKKQVKCIHCGVDRRSGIPALVLQITLMPPWGRHQEVIWVFLQQIAACYRTFFPPLAPYLTAGTLVMSVIDSSVLVAAGTKLGLRLAAHSTTDVFQPLAPCQPSSLQCYSDPLLWELNSTSRTVLQVFHMTSRLWHTCAVDHNCCDISESSS